MDYGSTWQTMPPCHFRRQRTENRSRVFVAKKISEKSLLKMQRCDKLGHCHHSEKRFCPPPALKKKVHFAFELFLIELPTYESGNQGIH